MFRGLLRPHPHPPANLVEALRILLPHSPVEGRILTLRPEVNVDEIKKQDAPTQTHVGLFFGYSLPIYAADNEELHFRQIVPGRWDEASDIEFHILVCLAGAEDVDDRFKIQLSWNQFGAGEVVPAATHDVEVEQVVLTGRNAQYDVYLLTFTIDYDADVGDPIAVHDTLGVRLRRVAATTSEVANEIVVLCWHDHYQVDKIFALP